MAQIYDRTAAELMREFAEKKMRDRNVLRSGEIVSWFAVRYPELRTTTIYQQIRIMTTNSPARAHNHVKADGSDDLFFSERRGEVRLFDPTRDPPPLPGMNGPWQHRLEATCLLKLPSLLWPRW